MKKRPGKVKKTTPKKPEPSMPSTDEQALLLPLSMIRPSKNVREKLEDIESLAESIRANGLLQPLIVCKRGGHFILVAGQRRYKALQLLKLSHAPVRFLAIDEREERTIQVLENVQRQQLTGPEEIRAVANLLPFFQGNQSALARSIGKDQTYVNRCARAAKLLSQINYATSHTPVTKSLLFQLADTEDPKELWDQIQGGDVQTVRAARERSGAVAGGRFVEGAIKFRERGNAFTLRLNFDPDRTPGETRSKILDTLRKLIEKLEVMK